MQGCVVAKESARHIVLRDVPARLMEGKGSGRTVENSKQEITLLHTALHASPPTKGLKKSGITSSSLKLPSNNLIFCVNSAQSCGTFEVMIFIPY
ncbi:hypothetical protein AVEN_78661-1 [Araneus ventricosus]|uniref:Uncharacterized protein n=1 Tax=Araneus ventricosus TaxID=182803 RepID=A0A4Y2RJ68_ARAVE|nr:hypothetical protein AVEN_78661-1 [Araneus ventricosus]